jgi:V/A-type H+-transporting ATPase subunit E
MNNHKENLENIVAKLKQDGIQAGEAEKQRIIDDAKKQAEVILAEARKQAKGIVDEAQAKTEQLENNARTALAQASRDMTEATKVAIIKHLQSVFGAQGKNLFTQKEYMEVLLKTTLESISGQKQVTVPEPVMKDMEEFLINESLNKEVELTPLAGANPTIIIKPTSNNGLQFVLSSDDVEKGLFSLVNKDLVKRITQNTEN